MTVTPIVIDVLGTVTKGLVQGLEDFENRGRVETIQTTDIIKIGQNAEKSPRDLKRLVVTETHGKPSPNTGVKNSSRNKMIKCYFFLIRFFFFVFKGMSSYLVCPVGCFLLWQKIIRVRGSSNAGALGNAENPFIAIAPKFTLVRGGNTW